MCVCVCACLPFWCPLVRKRAHHSLVSISSAWVRGSAGDGTWPALQAFQLLQMQTSGTTGLRQSHTNNFGIKFLSGLDKSKGWGGEDERKCLLSSSWKARVEVRLTMLKKAKIERYPFYTEYNWGGSYHQIVSFSATSISLVQRGLHLLESHGSSYSCVKGVCFAFMAPDSLYLS